MEKAMEKFRFGVGGGIATVFHTDDVFVNQLLEDLAVEHYYICWTDSIPRQAKTV